jgi:hypothetical protein
LAAGEVKAMTRRDEWDALAQRLYAKGVDLFNAADRD